MFAKSVSSHIDEFEIVGSPEELAEKSPLFSVLVEPQSLTILSQVTTLIRPM